MLSRLAPRALARHGTSALSLAWRRPWASTATAPLAALSAAAGAPHQVPGDVRSRPAGSSAAIVQWESVATYASKAKKAAGASGSGKGKKAGKGKKSEEEEEDMEALERETLEEEFQLEKEYLKMTMEAQARRRGPGPVATSDTDEEDEEEDEEIDVPTVELPELTANRDLINNFMRLNEKFVESLSNFTLKFLEPMDLVFHEPHILYRSTAHLLVEELDRRAEKADKEFPLVLIDGAYGTGKSVTMLHAVHHAVQNGWAVIYIPNASEFSRGKFTYEPVEKDGQTVWQQPDGSQVMLKHVKAVNGTVLEKIPISSSRSIGKRSINTGAPLSELVQLGIDDKSCASDVMSILMAELAQQDIVPTLFALDSIDVCLWPTQYNDTNGTPLTLESFTMFKEFFEYIRDVKQLKRGAVMTARSDMHPRRGRLANPKRVKINGEGDVTPRMLTDDHWLHKHNISTDKTAVLVMSNFAVEETEAVCDMVWMTNDLSEFPYRDEAMGPMLQTVSQGNPRLMFTQLAIM